MKKGLALSLLSFMLVVTANAEVYRYKDSKGKTVFSDQPPSGQNAEKMFVRPPVGTLTSSTSQAATNAAEPVAKIETPKNHEVKAGVESSEQLQAEVLKQQQTTSDLNQRVAEYNRKIKEDNCRRVTDNIAKAKSASSAVQAQLKKEQQEWCQ